MLYGKDIICISSIDWDFIWQGHQEIMSVLAGNGNRVLFVENTGVRAPKIKDLPRIWQRLRNWKKGYRGIRKESDNLFIYSPLVLPFPYSWIARKINRTIMSSIIKKWMKVLEFRNPIIWSFLPTALVLDMLDEWDPSMFIYYCIDDFVSSSEGAKKIKSAEEKVIKRADLVFTTSYKLLERCHRLNNLTYRFPFGVSIDCYNKIREKETDIPDDMLRIPRPIIGYVGGLHKWVDQDLLRRIAEKEKGVSLVLIGPGQTDLTGIKDIKNIFILGKKSKEELPEYIKYFDAGIIPYLKTPYTENVYPTKMNEYLAMGKAVISTKIPEVVKFDQKYGKGLVYLLDGEREIQGLLDKISVSDNEKVKRRVEVANSNSWKVRIEEMSVLMETRLTHMQKNMTKNWVERLNNMYVHVRKKTLKITAVFLVFYIIIFYSPLLWILAAPLKISQEPEKVDAILVFGGGVGETGSPGKSTIERAVHSVELFKKGYSKKVIFSSGYTVKHKDATNMKLFAMSMGVPERHIILEEEANSCYENVKYTVGILRRKNFNKVILVSSPYNMLRASLVFANLAKDIEVVFVPVPDPQFYHKQEKVEIRQIRAVLHEYLGILYYKIKGYI